MKLDKIKFARLVAHISNIMQRQSIDSTDINMLDDLIDIDVPEQAVVRPSNDDIERLMALMAAGTQKIEAIKIHRSLTGMGLRESKDAVEKYWVDRSIPPKAMFAGV